jgi:hypothetical protein
VTARGYVVTRPYAGSGVGSNLGSLAGALWFARLLERTLVVDWRAMAQLRDPDVNFFSLAFDTPAELLGTPVLYAPAPEAGDYAPDSGAAWLSPNEAAAIAAGRAAPPETTIVLEPYHGLNRLHPGPDPERFKTQREIYRAFALAPELERKARAWWDETYGGSFVVGVNVRHGNGAHFGKGMPYEARLDMSVFDDLDRFRATIERACRQRARALPPSLREALAVFYATDSGLVASALAQLPRAASRRLHYPPPGSGDEHKFDRAGYSDRDGVTDSVIDMFLLARCDALVYNNTMFNEYARVATGLFGGGEVHLESLFTRLRVRRLATRMRARLP